MISELNPHTLTWDEVDPSRHAFDGAAVARTVRSLGPARCVPVRSDAPSADPAVNAWRRDEATSWAHAMAYALVQQYGRWTVGWRWGHGESDFDGGPVGSWCCPEHSVTTSEKTLARVEAALCEWREWLEYLARWFEAYPLDLGDIEEQRILWERAARNLILQVIDRTGCDSGWYGHCRQVLTWFLDHWGIAPDVARDLVDEAVGGRFRSWTDPGTAGVDEVAERLAVSLRPSHGRVPVEVAAPDHLERWLAVRGSVAWHGIPDGGTDGPVVPRRDGAAEDVRAFDGAIDPARAEGLAAALELVRADAARGAQLDFALLGSWQQLVLGTARPPRFRTAPAFAKGGGERYGIGPDTRARFATCLAESTSGTGPGLPLGLTARAARVYLDICFFHPFDDGNARAAFLALVFVLARAGIALDGVGLLRRIAFKADSPDGPLALGNFINVHLTETRGNSAAR